MLHAGEIPLSLFNISSLREINLENNNLYGSLPDEMCLQLSQLESFALSNNHYEGVIPRSIGNCTSLQELYLGNNSFTGILVTLYIHFILLINIFTVLILLVFDFTPHFIIICICGFA